MKRLSILLAVVVALSVSAVTVMAQSGGTFTLNWFSVDGGGGTASGTGFTLASTIGQPDAGTMSGGQFTIAGGFQSAGIASNKTATPTRTTTPGATLTPTRTLTPTKTLTPTVTPTSCAVKPSKPTLLKPKNNSVTTKTRVVLKWAAATCAVSYSVTVKDAVTKKTADSKKNLTGLKYKTKTLAQGKSYKWSVKACNPIGCVRSAQRTFTIQ